MTKMRFLSVAIILVLAGLLAGCRETNTGSTSEASSAEVKEKVDVFNKTEEGLALGGYDAVAYFQ